VPDAESLDADQMRRVAREFNQSETTFLLSPTRPGADRRLRCFTPTGAEVFGAGHNALGAWWWLAETGHLPRGRSAFAQELGDGVLPVEVAWGPDGPKAVVMTQSPPRFGAVLRDVAPLAAALRLAEVDLAIDDLLPQVVSTGAAHLLVPVRTREAVDGARPDAELLAAVLYSVGGQGCYLFCLEPVDATATAYARFFNPTVGIVEDPATGSAAGPLACQLAARGRVPEGTPIVVEQGYALGRPSRIEAVVSGADVRILGRGATAAWGTLRLP
jgi:PhzF family phenazine biosynthesis protein